MGKIIVQSDAIRYSYSSQKHVLLFDKVFLLIFSPLRVGTSICVANKEGHYEIWFEYFFVNGEKTTAHTEPKEIIKTIFKTKHLNICCYPCGAKNKDIV